MELMWKPAVFQAQAGRSGIKARDHFDALRLVRDQTCPGLRLHDGDGHPSVQNTADQGDRSCSGFAGGATRSRATSFIRMPSSTRFVAAEVGPGSAEMHVAGHAGPLAQRMFPPAVVNDPLGESRISERQTKARTRLLPPMLDAAGLHGLPYTRYHEIAALMLPEEIHPEVIEKLDAICRAFGVEP